MVLIRYFGHACFLIEGCAGKVLIDPFLNENPVSPVKANDIKDIDLILVTHGHYDHLGDTIEIALNTKAKVVAIYELAMYISKFGIDVIPMNIGGTIEYNGMKVTMVPALHSSSIIEEGEDKIRYMGNPCGYIIEIDGRRIYHAGDTMVFKDMELFPEIFGEIDIALLPIGGRFTMDVKQANIAIKLLKPKVVIPMHYNTWDLIKADPGKLEGAKIVVLKPGESFEY